MAHKRIAIVGDHWDKYEGEKGQPFCSSAWRFLHVLMKAVGMDHREVELLNVFDFYPRAQTLSPITAKGKENGIPGMPAVERGRYVLPKYEPDLALLYRRLEKLNPNIIIPLGPVATWALLHSTAIDSIRGAPMIGVTGHKVLPTYHTKQAMRKGSLRPVIWADLTRALRESFFPEVRRPARKFWLEPTIKDLLSFEKYVKASDLNSVDIETIGDQISCVGFAPDPTRAIVIPFIAKDYPDQNYWPDPDTELEAWSVIRRWLRYPNAQVGQNFNYDMSYFYDKYHLRLCGPVEDTMYLHHAKEIEMKKSLGFQGTLYTDEPNWKFMRKTKTIKKED